MTVNVYDSLLRPSVYSCGLRKEAGKRYVDGNVLYGLVMRR